MDNDNDILNDLDSFSEPEESKKKEVKKEDKVSENKETKGTTKKTVNPTNAKTEMKTIGKVEGANVIRKAEQVEKANVGDINTKTQFTLSDYKTSSESVIYFIKKYHKHINNDTIIPPPYVKCLDCAFARWGVDELANDKKKSIGDTVIHESLTCYCKDLFTTKWDGTIGTKRVFCDGPFIAENLSK